MASALSIYRFECLDDLRLLKIGWLEPSGLREQPDRDGQLDGEHIE